MIVVRWVGWILDKFEELLIVACLAFMTVMNFINVVSRYLFTNSFSFTEELTIMAFVWVSMLGISAGYKRKAHLGMSYLTEKFPYKWQAALAVFSMLCSLVTMIYLIDYGIEMVEGQIMLNSRTPALDIPSIYQSLSIPVGGAFIALRTLQAGFSEFMRLMKAGKEAEQRC